MIRSTPVQRDITPALMTAALKAKPASTITSPSTVTQGPRSCTRVSQFGAWSTSASSTVPVKKA